MPGFLEKLKYNDVCVSEFRTSIDADKVCFRISITDDGAFLEICDPKGVVINPDYRLFEGPSFNVLKTINQIKRDSAFSINWGEESNGLSLSAHPQLTHLLMDCNNVFLGTDPILPDVEHVWNLQADILSSDKKCKASFSLNCEGELLHNPVLLNESFAICEKRLVRLRTMVENFAAIPVFEESFHKDLLYKFLSVFYSQLRSVDARVDGNPVLLDTEAVRTSPTIIIEKVDQDKALYLRLTQEINGLESDFIEDFRLSMFAFPTTEGTIKVRPIAMMNTPAMQADLLKRIASFAPTKADVKEIYSENGTFIIPEATAARFLFGGLASLVHDYRLVGAERLKGYQVRPVTPKLSVNIGSGIDFLEADAKLDVSGEEFTLESFLDQYRRQRYILLSDGDKAVIDELWVKRLERLFSKAGKGKSKVSFFDLPEIAALLEDGALADNAAMKRSREFYRGFNSLSDSSVDAGGIKAQLRPYQESGVKWLNYLYDNNFGACLADDMGLGKTVQTIALISRTAKLSKKKSPVLIVMPKSLLFNWEAELARFAPALKFETYYGQYRTVQTALKADVVLTTYGMVRSDIDELRKHKFRLVVLDESQNIKNVTSQMSQAVLLLDSDHRLALSGTPVENNIMELYSLFRFLNPAMFGKPADFKEKYGNLTGGPEDQDAADELRRKIYPFILRRTKSEVLTELPDRTDQKIFVTLDEDHARFYEQKRRAFSEAVHQGVARDGINKSRFLILQALSELRRIASVPESMSDSLVKSSKIPVLLESMEEAVANGHKLVVFFNFIAGIELVGEELDKAGISYEVITGSTSGRGNIVSRFQNDPSCKVLLMTLKTGGVGLNLTAADMVYIFEPWWNRAEEEQAIGRLHRIGQKAKVMTFSIVASGTIEEKICLLQEKKKSLVDSLINSDGSIDKTLSEEDIDFILA